MMGPKDCERRASLALDSVCAVAPKHICSVAHQGHWGSLRSQYNCISTHLSERCIGYCCWSTHSVLVVRFVWYTAGNAVVCFK